MLKSLQFSCPVMSDSLRPHGLQHARPPCPSASPGVCPSSCSLYQSMYSQQLLKFLNIVDLSVAFDSWSSLYILFPLLASVVPSFSWYSSFLITYFCSLLSWLFCLTPSYKLFLGISPILFCVVEMSRMRSILPSVTWLLHHLRFQHFLNSTQYLIVHPHVCSTFLLSFKAQSSKILSRKAQNHSSLYLFYFFQLYFIYIKFPLCVPSAPGLAHRQNLINV